MRAGLRSDLPPLPERMWRLPLDARGYPVPWFVAWIDGVPDFRVIRQDGIATAWNRKICWLCGQPLGRFLASVIGPMCALNRTTSEPPCHRECALFAAKACPFLTRPNAERRSAKMPEGWVEPAGVMIRRNPGVALVWVTREIKPFATSNGVLFEVGAPVEVIWFAEGRAATADEIEASIETGLPALLAEVPTNDRELSEGLTFISKRLEETWELIPGKPTKERNASKLVLEALSKAHLGHLKSGGALT